MPFLTHEVHFGNELLRKDDPHQAHDAFQQWVNAVSKLLDRLFPASGLTAEWIALPYSNLVCGGTWSKKNEDWIPYRQAVTDRIAWLGKLQKAELTRKEAGAKPTSAPVTSRKIFVVHGRDKTYRDATARLLEKLGLDPIILHEQPNKGRTIIEKFTEHADVGFAVVLLTGDDEGGLKGTDPTTQKLRARQNVVLELGYFLGRLGRERVCPLYEPGVELPSDYDGVIWTELGGGDGWKYELAKEINAAGIAVDLNKVI